MSEALSKAAILLALESQLKVFKIPKLIAFTVKSIRAKSYKDLQSEVIQFLGVSSIIIRSSAVSEDSEGSSMAGAYQSVPGVMLNDYESFVDAVEKVISSYEQTGENSLDDEVIFQHFISESIMSGVVFTHELNTGAPYYVINYDDISGATDTVTSGGGEYANRTLYIHRPAVNAIRSERFRFLITAVQELEQALGSQFLDVEFALDKNMQPYLFQVRGITTQPNWNRSIVKSIEAELRGVVDFLSTRFKKINQTFGSTTVFGQMPDWNPAEMIGRAPRALALSLYQALITNRAWRAARRAMGYQVPAGHPLMVSLAGQPFIDVRLSFHSFLPVGLPEKICEKLVDAWINRLRHNPELHDKVEFDIAITVFSFDIDDKIEAQVGDVLTAEEKSLFKDCLRQLTIPLLTGTGQGAISLALEKIKKLSKQDIEIDDNLSTLMPLIENTVEYGTEPFAVLARHGFIARSILLSLVSRKIFSMDEVNSFYTSIRTITSDFVEDMQKLRNGKLSNKDFMLCYGHLRPGTYDILSKRYDQMDFFSSESLKDGAINVNNSSAFSLTDHQKTAIKKLLDEENFFGVDSETLLSYCKSAIAGREYGKFVFTKTISAMLETIAFFGERHGLSREELSHISIQQLLDLELNSNGASTEDKLRVISQSQRDRHLVTSSIRLPQILFDEAGVHVVPFQVSHPNFITNLSVVAPVVYIRNDRALSEIEGCIILIENADPGYDWIFSRKIAGLITKYGGANSHMAIRCAEFGIPAAIGCGEQRFIRLISANKIRLDSSSGLIIPLY